MMDNNWISVKDRLPEETGKYLVAGIDWHTKRQMSTMLFSAIYNEWMTRGAWREWKITHWMPLPEPPEVKEC